MKTLARSVILAVCLLTGCGSRDTMDPTIELESIGKIQVAISKSTELKEFFPVRIVATKNEPESWLVSFVKLNDTRKRATVRIAKKDLSLVRISE